MFCMDELNKKRQEKFLECNRGAILTAKQIDRLIGEGVKFNYEYN